MQIPAESLIGLAIRTKYYAHSAKSSPSAVSERIHKSKPRRAIRTTPSSASPRARTGSTTRASTKSAPNGTALCLSNLANFSKTLLKGQLVSLEGKIKYRMVEEEVEGKPFKHTIAEIHASSMRRLSKVEAADDQADGADEE
jgi:single-stranded DNA-binding protein